MQIASKATLLAVLAVVVSSASMLIDTSSAVEVTPASPPASAAEIRHAQAPAPPVGGVSAPPSPDSYVLGSRSFMIPFTVDGGTSQPIAVELFVSRGPTDSWTLFETKRPDEAAVKQFEFKADQDGEYWFATRTTRASGPAQVVSSIAPQLKVFIDTTKPVVELNAEADADGHVETQVKIHDATPLKIIQLRYITNTVGIWQSVDVSMLPADGRLHFTPPVTWEQLSLQLIATDTAGNQSVVSKLVHRPRIAEAIGNRYSAIPARESIAAQPTIYRTGDASATDARVVSGPANGYARHQADRVTSGLGTFRGADLPHGSTAPPVSSVPQNPPPTVARAVEQRFQQPPAAASTPSRVPFDAPSIYSDHIAAAKSRTAAANSVLPPPATLEQISNGFGLNGPQLSTPESPNPGSSPSGSPETVPVPSPQTEQTRRNRTLSEAMRPLSQRSAVAEQREVTADSQPQRPTESQRHQTARQSPTESPAVAQRVPVRYSDSERFSLEFELEAVGSQGVEAIELYGSLDEGRTWKLWGRDPDRSSPFDIETREEGVFGYRIVVVGGNGLASPRPQNGEPPDIVVVVDKQSPTVRISGAQYGEGDRIGALVIQYECADANLIARPVSLSFSENVDGPWTTIAAGLRNDGDYVWPADPQLPRQFFLRLDATDQAGNVGTYILDRPIDAQGLAPRARIRGFQSLSGMTPPGSSEQTANRPRASFK